MWAKHVTGKIIHIWAKPQPETIEQGNGLIIKSVITTSWGIDNRCSGLYSYIGGCANTIESCVNNFGIKRLQFMNTIHIHQIVKPSLTWSINKYSTPKRRFYVVAIVSNRQQSEPVVNNWQLAPRWIWKSRLWQSMENNAKKCVTEPSEDYLIGYWVLFSLIPNDRAKVNSMSHDC